MPIRGRLLQIGPMAQDFKAAFYPGRDNRTITTLEADGVALAAIQGLNKKLEEESAELRLELLEQRLDASGQVRVSVHGSIPFRSRDSRGSFAVHSRSSGRF